MVTTLEIDRNGAATPRTGGGAYGDDPRSYRPANGLVLVEFGLSRCPTTV
jgi:hypothetical protein